MAGGSQERIHDWYAGTGDDESCRAHVREVVRRILKKYIGAEANPAVTSCDGLPKGNVQLRVDAVRQVDRPLARGARHWPWTSGYAAWAKWEGEAGTDFPSRGHAR